MKKLITAVIIGVLAVIAVPVAANAAEPEQPKFTITSEGIYLAEGDVFTDGSHVNVRLKDGKTYSIQFEAKYANPNDANWQNPSTPFNHADPRNQYMGQSFLPLGALSHNGVYLNQKTPQCAIWAQVHTNKGYNYHFDANVPGVDPVGTGCGTPQEKVEYGDWTGFTVDCTTQEGDVIDRTRQVTVTYYHWNGEVKETKTFPETNKYTITAMDILAANLECRTALTPIAPTLTKAEATCVDQHWTVTKPATVALAATLGGHWLSNGNVVSGTVALTGATDFTFVADDETTHYVTGNATFTMTPNVIDEAVCELTETGGTLASWLIPTAAVLLLGGAALFIVRRKELV